MPVECSGRGVTVEMQKINALWQRCTVTAFFLVSHSFLAANTAKSHTCICTAPLE